VAEKPPRFDRDAVERTLAELIRTLGLDPGSEPELAATPARAAALYEEIFSGLRPGSEPDLAIFPAPSSGGRTTDLVVVRDVPFYSLCVHHFVPFFGRGHVAYLPGRDLMGISGAARLLEHYARRPQLQERIASQVADHLELALAPRGVAVVLEARHLCMEMRGIHKPGVVETRVLRGELADPRWAAVLPVSGGQRRDPHQA